MVQAHQWKPRPPPKIATSLIASPHRIAQATPGPPLASLPALPPSHLEQLLQLRHRHALQLLPAAVRFHGQPLYHSAHRPRSGQQPHTGQGGCPPSSTSGRRLRLLAPCPVHFPLHAPKPHPRRANTRNRRPAQHKHTCISFATCSMRCERVRGAGRPPCCAPPRPAACPQPPPKPSRNMRRSVTPKPFLRPCGGQGAINHSGHSGVSARQQEGVCKQSQNKPRAAAAQ